MPQAVVDPPDDRPLGQSPAVRPIDPATSDYHTFGHDRCYTDNQDLPVPFWSAPASSNRASRRTLNAAGANTGADGLMGASKPSVDPPRTRKHGSGNDSNQVARRPTLANGGFAFRRRDLARPTTPRVCHRRGLHALLRPGSPVVLVSFSRTTVLWMPCAVSLARYWYCASWGNTIPTSWSTRVDKIQVK